jgi:hypothetical protein
MKVFLKYININDFSPKAKKVECMQRGEALAIERTMPLLAREKIKYELRTHGSHKEPLGSTNKSNSGSVDPTFSLLSSTYNAAL